MPQNIPTLEKVRLSHERFWIEQGYQQLKEELGLDTMKADRGPLHIDMCFWCSWHSDI